MNAAATKLPGELGPIHFVGIGGYDQGVGALVRLDGGRVVGTGFLRASAGIQPVDVLHDPGQHVGDILGLGVLQIHHPNIATLFQRRVQMLDQLVHARPFHLITADQYIAIVLPGRMYRAEFARRGLAPQNLSRTLEDAGTMTSALVPWNTCGAFMASTLGVATFAYLPFALFNLINPVVSLIYGITGFTILKIDSDEEAEIDGESRIPPEAVDEAVL